MVRLLFILLIVSLDGVVAAEVSYSSIAEAFTAGHGQEQEISYRVYTAPMLTEISALGILVERLEISPLEIRVRVGDSFSLDQIRITAFGPDGGVQERVPLTVGLEGPAEMLDFVDFVTYGEEIHAVQSGQAKIWIRSILPSSSGERVRRLVLLVVDK